MPPNITHIPNSAQRRVRWKNGAGWTTEIAAHPADEFDWRLSVAEVDADCDFSSFPGIDRTILVLTGAGFTLHVGDDPPVHLTAGGPTLAFSGDRPARCRVAGPTRDFNVMTRRDRCAHSLTRLTLRGPHPLHPAGTLAIYVVDGHARLADYTAAAGDCLLLEPAPSDISSHTLDGEAALVLVTVTAPSTRPRGTTD